MFSSSLLIKQAGFAAGSRALRRVPTVARPVVGSKRCATAAAASSHPTTTTLRSRISQLSVRSTDRTPSPSAASSKGSVKRLVALFESATKDLDATVATRSDSRSATSHPSPPAIARIKQSAPAASHPAVPCAKLDFQYLAASIAAPVAKAAVPALRLVSTPAPRAASSAWAMATAVGMYLRSAAAAIQTVVQCALVPPVAYTPVPKVRSFSTAIKATVSKVQPTSAPIDKSRRDAAVTLAMARADLVALLQSGKGSAARLPPKECEERLAHLLHV